MMDRRLMAGLLGLFVTGCALSQSKMPETGRKDQSVGVEGLPPIDASINQTTPPTDTAARRADHVPATDQASADTGDAKPASVSPPVTASGRPAPFADRTNTSARLQAPPASGPAEDQPADPRPAPIVETSPPVTRPTASAPSSTSSNHLPALPPLLPAREVETAAVEAPKVDSAVVPAAAPAKAVKPKAPPEVTLGMGGQIAAVGNEVITDRQLKAALKDRQEKIPPEQWNDPQTKLFVTKGVLNEMIERTLILQAVKKQIKDVKNLQTVYDGLDRDWLTKEMPPLLRQTNSANIHELKLKFKEVGKSLDTIREDYRMNTLAREYMLSKIQSRMTVSLPEKQKFYMAHLKDFDGPAEIAWREIAIENAKCTNREEARRKIESILGRIKKGEDFAKIAKAESHGATADKGGLWEITPGGFGLPEVNEALATLAPKQISGVIEAPGGFHLVFVESKRDAGPKRFDEVQDKIQDSIMRAKYARLSEEFIEKLRRNTVITTIFDVPDVDTSAVRTSTDEAKSR